MRFVRWMFWDDRGFVPKWDRRIRRLATSVSAFGIACALGLAERAGRASLCDKDTPVTVSLTSYGERAQRVHLAIESIGRGRVRPSRIVLWLDDPLLLESLPAPLRRQRRRGLEVRLSENYGPHTKYWPAACDDELSTRPLITADDDIMYPSYWLGELLAASAQTPNEVVAHRAHEITCFENGIARYSEWNSVRDRTGSLRVFATGVSGVLYPVIMQIALRKAGDHFGELAPVTDDVWLHHVALKSNIRVRQVTGRSEHFWLVPGSQTRTLMQTNLTSENDAAIQRLYSRSDVEALSRQ